VTDLDVLVWGLTLLGVLLGGWAIYWTRSPAQPLRSRCGRCLFLLAMMELGATALVAAWTHALSLAPMGIVSVLLVVAMLWETPAAQWQQE